MQFVELNGVYLLLLDGNIGYLKGLFHVRDFPPKLIFMRMIPRLCDRK